MQYEKSIEMIEGWRADGKRIGFINGCFDCLHAGHVNLIDNAYKHCDRLVVGVNSDESVRELKGSRRPVETAEVRASRVSDHLKPNDIVYIFHDEAQLLDMVKIIRPHALIKGDTYSIDEIVGADFIRKNGGEIVFVPRLKGISTSTIIKRREE